MVIKSYPSHILSTANNIQFTVPKDTYKVAIALQSDAGTIRAGAMSTKFTSGSTFQTQSAYSDLMTGLQIMYAGASFPSAPYQLIKDADQQGDMDAFVDYHVATEADIDPAGGYSYNKWSDPTVQADYGLGRIFVFDIVKPFNSNDTSLEISITFSGAPTTTRLWAFTLSKTAIAIDYNALEQPELTKAVPYS